MRNSLTIVGASQAIILFVSILRNFVLARILGISEFGIAAALILTVTMFDVVSETGMDRLMIQSPKGDGPEFQEMGHFVLLTRGAALCIGMAAISYPAAQIFRAPAAVWSFLAVCLVPLFRGTHHLDAIRLQRSGNFAVDAGAAVGAEMAMILVSCLMAQLTKNNSSVAVGLAARAAVYSTLTHLLSVRPYRLQFHRSLWTEMIGYGGVFALSGLVLFVSLNIDRIAAGALLGPKAMATYSVAVVPLAALFAVFARSTRIFNLPLLSDRRTESAEGVRMVSNLKIYSIMGGLAIIPAYSAIYPFLVARLVGPDFRGPAIFYMLLGGTYAIRLQRVPMTLVLTAEGRAYRLLETNVWRLIALPLVAVGFYLWPSIITLAASAAFAEGLSLWIASRRAAIR